ncbi:MAG TPA: pyridoxal 5'-phosphate synthase [Pseudosphingobacterium sp.]|nr:pyridoxal 5'-phosphate synthase [Pseudosphingobacterium sp.]
MKTVNDNPFELFEAWYKEYRQLTHSTLPASCCLSTNGLDNYPNARFVALKHFDKQGFIVTGSIASRKGVEIERSQQIALTFWWEETGRQIRVQGDVEPIDDAEADRFFAERNRDSQIVSCVSKQGALFVNSESMIEAYEALNLTTAPIQRPADWSGYRIKPLRIEFLQFSKTRFHDRTLYERCASGWKITKLQP